MVIKSERIKRKRKIYEIEKKGIRREMDPKIILPWFSFLLINPLNSQINLCRTPLSAIQALINK